VGAGAFDELARLGYTVDSSATPQRPGILSSFPGDSPYLWARRSPHFVPPTLLEVPTSCALIPLAAPSFQTLRRVGGLGARELVRMRDPRQIARLSQQVIRTLQSATLTTFAAVRSAAVHVGEPAKAVRGIAPAARRESAPAADWISP
jgi:hypothetical protein